MIITLEQSSRNGIAGQMINTSYQWINKQHMLHSATEEWLTQLGLWRLFCAPLHPQLLSKQKQNDWVPVSCLFPTWFSHSKMRKDNTLKIRIREI